MSLSDASLDGENHFTDDGKAHDMARDRLLSNKGYEVLRVPGYQVIRDANAVGRQIELAIDNRLAGLGSLTPSPSPSAD